MARADQHYAGEVSMRTRSWRRLLDNVMAVRVPIPDYLVAQRGGELMASSFDRRTHSVVGLPVAVSSTGSVQAAPQFAVSDAGRLVVTSPGGERAAPGAPLGWRIAAPGAASAAGIAAMICRAG